MEFYEKDHIYRHNGEIYKSVTSLVSDYKPDKDWEKIAENYAKKNGGTAQSWQDVWNQNRIRSADRGTLYHKTREDEAISEGYISCRTEDGVKYAIDLDTLDGKYTELIIFDPYFKVAGTSDRVIVENKEVSIRDFKTTPEVSYKPKIFAKAGSRGVVPKYKVPLSSLEETDINAYMLQLSCYAYMLERRGYKVGKLTIEQVIFEDPKGPVEDQIVKDIIEHEIKYSKIIAHSALEYYRLSLNKRNNGRRLL